MVASAPAPEYHVGRDNDDAVIARALAILRSRVHHPDRSVFDSPEAVKDWLQLNLAPYEHEVFACLFLTNQHALIAYEELFRGTIDGASVYPREIVKAALAHNAAAVMFAHNHPSGTPDPSQADRALTTRLKTALNTIDVRVLDHFVITADAVTSFAERGLL